MAFVILPTLGILTMKLVERRVARWFRRWAEREAARVRRTRR
jgi:peptidoglycan/LPS O-acetylase OafA/YrhL